ncbi:ATP synthase complex assembly protein atp12, partial [Cladochytrium tenue]
YHQDESEVDAPAELQQRFWAPLIGWAQREFGVEVRWTCGIVSVRQSDDTVAAFRAFLRSLDGVELAAFERAVLASKSVLIAAALVRRVAGVEFAVQAARVEVTHQTTRWGEVQD